MKNWQALGQPDKAAQSRTWAIAIAVVIFVMTVAAILAPQSKAIDAISRFGGFGILIAWYYASGKPQQAYVQGHFDRNYPRRGWTVPLLLGVVALVAFVGVSAFLLAMTLGMGHPN